MFRSKFIVKKVGELRSSTATLQTSPEREGVQNGEVSRSWKARDIVLEEDNDAVRSPESVVVTLWGDDACLTLVPGMQIEVSVFLKAKEGNNGRFYTDTDYSGLKIY